MARIVKLNEGMKCFNFKFCFSSILKMESFFCLFLICTHIHFLIAITYPTKGLGFEVALA